MAFSVSTNTNSSVQEDQEEAASSHHHTAHDLPPDLEHPLPLEHKLMVKSADGKISNLLCPIELVLESQNYSAPLIPLRYDPAYFCMFQNVASNSFKASTPRAASRKRKSDSSLSRSSKKRKKMPQKAPSKSPSNRLHDDALDDYFQFEPTLNVNSRPKRQRKKVSYTEPDANHIPVVYVKPAAAAKSGSRALKKTGVASKTKAVPKTAVSAAAASTKKPGHKMERFVEMRWVQCDQCLKWRRIPTSISDKELSGEWLCSMNKWDLKRNSCSAPEEAYDLAEEQTVEVTNGESSGQDAKREAFYRELRGFYASPEMGWKGLDVAQLEEAKIGDKAIDFLQLYLEITRRGGYHFCVASKLFDEVFASLQCFQAPLVQEASRRLQNLYAKYLNDYEQKMNAKDEPLRSTLVGEAKT